MSRRGRILRRLAIVLTWLLGLFAAMLTLLALALYSVSHVPSPDELTTNQLATITYSDGSVMARYGAENRVSVPLSVVPDGVRAAVLAAEDRGFYSEPGISIRGTLRAAINDLRGGSAQGGSTITQQYVKNAYLNSDQTLSRKLKEAAIALKLSRDYSKDQILENYLNTIYFGRGAYGIQAASQAYFGLDVGKLSVSQAALLAAVIKSPEYYDPRANLAAAQRRWTYVIDGMVSTGKLTEAQRSGLSFPPTLIPKKKADVLAGPMGLVWTQVKQELAAHGIDAAEINARGLTIQTTIDRKAQSAAQKAVKTTFANMTAEQKKESMRPALTAVRPSDGAVLAYYGNSVGTDFDYANGYRPPGSSFKPYTLATALSQNLAAGPSANSGTGDSGSTGTSSSGRKLYAIDSTYDGSYCVTVAGTKICNDPGDAGVSGPSVRLDFAMKVSLNTVFDGLANEVGPDNVRETAWAAGIRKTDNAGRTTLENSAGQTTFGIGIGDSDYRVRPLDQAVGYATIANGGTAHDAYFVSSVRDASGSVIYKHQTGGTRAMDPKVANDVGLTLEPIAAWSNDDLDNGRVSGAKTGTAGLDAAPGVRPEDVGKNSDAWMVGYTPQVSAAVWVGSGGSVPISNAYGGQEYGADLPGKTWKLFMDTYLAGKPNLPLPKKQMIFNGSDTTPSASPSSSAPSSTPESSAAPSLTTGATTGATSTPPPASATATKGRPRSSAPRVIKTCNAAGKPAGCTSSPPGGALATAGVVPTGGAAATGGG